MLVGALQSFQFFRQNTWFLENNRALPNFFMRFCITKLVLPKLQKKSVLKTQIHINHVSHLNYDKQ